MSTMLNSFLFCGFHGRVLSMFKLLRTFLNISLVDDLGNSRYFLGIPWENWFQTSFLNPSPNSRKASWHKLSNQTLPSQQITIVSHTWTYFLTIKCHNSDFCSSFSSTNCSHQPSGVSQSFLMFRGVTTSRVEGRKRPV